MTRNSWRRPWAISALGVLAVVASGCSGLPANEATASAAQWAGRQGAGPVALAVSETERERLRQARQRALATPLNEADAVSLALQNGTRAQQLLLDGWVAQSERAANAGGPSLAISLERVIHGDERAYGQTIALGLVDWITWPMRQEALKRDLTVQRLSLARDLLALQVAVRQQWIRAVAAQQLVSYHEQVLDAADAGAELAKRLQQVGNFSRLQNARQLAYRGDAQAQLERARLQATVEREALIRVLDLDADEAARLRLPERLPDLPASIRDRASVAAAARGDRLDLAIAHAEWQRAARTNALAWTSMADVGLVLGREREGTGRSRSTELEWHVPWLDTAALRQQSARLGAQAAADRLSLVAREAQSHLRERHATYAAAHTLAVQARDELVPLRRAITDEMLLKYNGMLVGVFDLLLDARAQVAAVISALEAQRDFWLAHVALDAAIVGIPASATLLAPAAAGSADASGGH